MSVTILRNFPPLTDLKLTSRELMHEVGLLARDLIYQRTISGRDQSDAPFAPYSRAYAETKARAVGTTEVNLQLSGAMLNAMQIVHVDDESVEIGFTA
jgi:hypothetical protein